MYIVYHNHEDSTRISINIMIKIYLRIGYKYLSIRNIKTSSAVNRLFCIFLLSHIWFLLNASIGYCMKVIWVLKRLEENVHVL